MLSMKVNEAVMVTVELDLGKPIPKIADALKEIAREYKPDDGAGRTFAILDAYGEPTAEGKLHISMHVSSEKTGIGRLIFKRTGEILWQSKIKPDPTKPPFMGKNLNIYMDDGKGKFFTIDGSTNPNSILDAKVKELNKTVREFWTNNTEREFTFVYSACGCPVKVMVKRSGEKTNRTKELPVIFPDDPAAVAVINRLMKWQ